MFERIMYENFLVFRTMPTAIWHVTRALERKGGILKRELSASFLLHRHFLESLHHCNYIDYRKQHHRGDFLSTTIHKAIALRLKGKPLTEVL